MVLYQFDATIDRQIDKSVKATVRFYKSLHEASVSKGEKLPPPSFEDFLAMATGLMRASKVVELDRLRTQALKDVLERSWMMKLQNYATKKLMKDSYDKLLVKF